MDSIAYVGRDVVGLRRGVPSGAGVATTGVATGRLEEYEIDRCRIRETLPFGR